MERSLEILRAHQGEVAHLIQERIGIEQVPAALCRILDGRTLKTVVHFDP
jgi:Zn-dependent alcohol dehydrogenase